MDPLSIIASTIAIIEFSRKLSRGLTILRDLSHVPDEIAALLDELKDLQNVLAAVCVVIDQRRNLGGLAGCTDELNALLVKAESIFSTIAVHCGITIHQDLDSGQENNISSFAAPVRLDPSTRFRWLKDRKKIGAHRQRLKIIRLDIANYLASLNLIGSCSVLVELRDLASALRGLSKDQALLQQSLKNTVPNTIRIGLEQEGEEAQNFLAHDGKLGMRTLAVNSDTQLSVNSALHDLSTCSCSCHRISTVTTPGILQNVCGALTVKIHGIPGITPACNESVCSRSERSSLRISYRFPSWILNCGIDTLLSYSYPRGPQLSLSCTRILPCTSEIFLLAIQGNILGIESLFQRGLASPYDATSNYGYTALHYAIDYGHLDLCDFLLKQRARNDILDFNNKSSTDIAYSKLCTSDLDLCHKDRIQLMFDEEPWLEQQQFSVLHKIVLKLTKSKISLVDELHISTKEINTTDSDGRTPLSWAAELGNQDAVSTLLSFGADFKKASKQGNSPLQFACKSSSFETMCLLLDAESGNTHDDKWGQRLLNWTSYFQNDTRFIEKLLLQPGISINEVDHTGGSAIESACFRSNLDVVSYLLDHGADPNIAAPGSKPLLECINLNHHDVLNILLRKSTNPGVDLACHDYLGETCLHALARAANLTTASTFLRVLEDETITLDFAGLDTAQVGKDGLTARDLIRLRGNEDVREVLERILMIIERENASSL